MSELESMPRQRRSKSGRKWLRNPRLLKWTIFIGVMAYRLWRWWHSLTGSPGG